MDFVLNLWGLEKPFLWGFWLGFGFLFSLSFVVGLGFSLIRYEPGPSFHQIELQVVLFW